MPLADRDLPHLGDAVGHLADAEALGEDDPEGDGRGLSWPGGPREHEGDRGYKDDGEPTNHGI